MVEKSFASELGWLDRIASPACQDPSRHVAVGVKIPNPFLPPLKGATPEDFLVLATVGRVLLPLRARILFPSSDMAMLGAAGLTSGLVFLGAFPF